MAGDADARTPTDAEGQSDDAVPVDAAGAADERADDTDDLDDYLDPELDPVAGRESDDSLPGPFSLSQLVRALHFLVAGLLTPFVWFAYQDGNLPQVASLGLLVVLLLVAGVVTGRIAERRFG